MTQQRYWFPAKRYGWGWGFPLTWQGWIAFLGFLRFVLTGALLIHPRTNLAGYLISVHDRTDEIDPLQTSRPLMRLPLVG
jgi:hypothetical protein